MYPQGGWTIWSRPWGVRAISKRGQVSRICQELDVVVDGFMGRPLDAGPYPYLWLDALTRKVTGGRQDRQRQRGGGDGWLNGEGKSQEIIGMDVRTRRSEAGAFRLAGTFCARCPPRALGGVELVVSDGSSGTPSRRHRPQSSAEAAGNGAAPTS